MQTHVNISFPTQLPLTHSADILVIGGGPGGIGAAIAAARQGVDVLLVEHYGFLGGMATAGEVNPFMPNRLGKESLDQGIFEEWLTRIGNYQGLRENTRVFDPNIARLAAEDLCIEAGVRLLFHHRCVHVETEKNTIKHVVLHSKGGLSVVKAKQFIDSTGDGDLASLAGCEFEMGSEQSEHVQPMTLCFKLKLSPKDFPNGNAPKDYYPYIRQNMASINRAFKEAKASGELDCPRENVLIFQGLDDDIIHFNTTRVIHKSSIHGEQLSQAEIEGRKQLRDIVKFLNDHISFFKNAKVHSIAPQIGIRESRRILGKDYLRLEDYQKGCTYADGVTRITYPVDIHNPNGEGTQIMRLPPKSWYEIPWGCLISKDIDNLAIASRCISVDHAVHSSMRVMPPVCSLGQAAGTGAGIAIKLDKNLNEIDGRIVKENLIEQGRNLLPYNPEQPNTCQREQLHSTDSAKGQPTRTLSA